MEMATFKDKNVLCAKKVKNSRSTKQNTKHKTPCRNRTRDLWHRSLMRYLSATERNTKVSFVDCSQAV